MTDESQAPPGRGSTLDKYVIQVSLGTLWGVMAGVALFVFWALSHFATVKDVEDLEADQRATAVEIKALATSFAELRGQVSERSK